jgi:hypothetical protein
MSDTVAAFETREDAGEGEAGEVNLWLQAIEAARKEEEGWRKTAEETVKRYRDEEKRGDKRFNILFANVQTVLPAIYNSTPVPDVRRRFGDADAVGKIASQVLERAISYSADVYDFDGTMRGSCWDMEVAGRGAVRVRYDAEVNGDAIAYETVSCDYVDWRDFIRGPGRRWSEVPWIGFEHRLTREELVAKFGAIGKTMTLDFMSDTVKRDDPRDVPDIFKRGTVYEIWDKQRREVLFVAKSVPDRVLKREPDPLGLRDFFPLPRPLYSVLETGSLVPLVPYSLYRDQADELDRVTRRITGLIEVLKFRGLRASEITEFENLAKASDGEFVPVDNIQQFLGSTGGGGLERALWMMPIEQLVSTIRELVIHREQIKQVIYEITGLSDILRGATQASETATAQQLKAQWGSLRIQDRQAEVQRFARDLIRLKAEIIAEKFQPQTLATMSGIDLPTAEIKAQAQQAAMMAQQAGQQPPEGVEEVLSSPTWDDVLQVLRSDALRSYRIDIETDSTIQADTTRSQENAARFVEGLAGYIQAIGPAVQSGFIQREEAADILVGFARSFKLGRTAEDAIERIGKSPAPQQPDPMAAERAKMEAEVQKAQADAEARKAEADAKAQIERERIASQEKIASDKLAAEERLARDKMALEDQRHLDTLAVERDRMTQDRDMREADRRHAADLEREKIGSTEKLADVNSREKTANAILSDVQALTQAVQQVAANVQAVGDRVAGVEAAVSDLAAEVNAPVEAARGSDGRIAEVRRGRRVMRVQRGPAGEAMGLA